MADALHQRSSSSLSGSRSRSRASVEGGTRGERGRISSHGDTRCWLIVMLMQMCVLMLVCAAPVSGLHGEDITASSHPSRNHVQQLDNSIRAMEEALRQYALIKCDFLDNEYEQMQRHRRFYDEQEERRQQQSWIGLLLGTSPPSGQRGRGRDEAGVLSSVLYYGSLVMNPWRWATERLIDLAVLAAEVFSSSGDSEGDASGDGNEEATDFSREDDQEKKGFGSVDLASSGFLGEIGNFLRSFTHSRYTPLSAKARSSRARDAALHVLVAELLRLFEQEEPPIVERGDTAMPTHSSIDTDQTDGSPASSLSDVIATAHTSEMLRERAKSVRRLKGECGGAASELLLFEKSVRDIQRSAVIARSASQKYGDSKSQWLLGFLHSTGTAIEHSDSKSILHYYFAATGNNTDALVTMGNSLYDGVKMPRADASAVLYFLPVAKRIMERFKTKTVGTSHQRRHPRLDDVSMGAARAAMSDANNHAQQQDNDLFQYYQHNADMGDVQAQSAIGHLMNDGGLGWSYERERSVAYLRKAADGGDMTAMASLGHMYANGIGTEVNNETAIECFEKAAEKKVVGGFFGLAYMHLSGYGVEKNHARALEYFLLAANAGHLESHFYLGLMYLIPLGTDRDLGKAHSHLLAAAKHGHVVAAFNLASLYIGRRNGAEESFTLRVFENANPNRIRDGAKFFRRIVKDNYVSNVQGAAFDAYSSGDDEGALLLYMLAAQMGSARSTANAAWMLEKNRGVGGEVAKHFPGGPDHLLISLLRHSAESGNMRSRLRLGDMFYYGRGVEKNMELAAQSYQEAAEEGSAQAIFNLGMMHQFGQGLKQDFHLAKRRYDTVFSDAHDGYWPAFVAITLLRTHMYLDGVYEHVRSLIGDTLQRNPESLFGVFGVFQTGSMLAVLATSPEVVLGCTIIVLLFVLAMWRLWRKKRQSTSSSATSRAEAIGGGGDDGAGEDVATTG